MSTPLDSTRDAPISTTIRDCLVAAWIDDTANGSPCWMIDIGGDEHTGPSVDRAKHADLSGVKDMLREWAKSHPQLFA